MSSRRTVILIAAIALGVFAGIALLSYVRGIEDDVYADAQPVKVLIASEDIPKGTSAADALLLMEEHDIPLEIRPATFVPVDNTEIISGLVALSPIPKNQIIVSGLFVDPQVVQAAFRDQIPSGQVAVTLPIGQTQAVGGYIQPGDEVNIMVVHDPVCGSGSDDEEDEDEEGEVAPPSPLGGDDEDEDTLVYCSVDQPARYIFQRVEVLAVGARQTLQPGQTGETVVVPQGGVLTFMVPNEAAQLLASLEPGSVYLTLLPEDYAAEPQRPFTLEMLEGPMPAEMPECLTPYGPAGFIAGDSVNTVDNEGEPAEHYSCELLWGE